MAGIGNGRCPRGMITQGLMVLHRLITHERRDMPAPIVIIIQTWASALLFYIDGQCESLDWREEQQYRLSRLSFFTLIIKSVYGETAP